MQDDQEVSVLGTFIMAAEMCARANATPNREFVEIQIDLLRAAGRALIALYAAAHINGSGDGKIDAFNMWRWVFTSVGAPWIFGETPDDASEMALVFADTAFGDTLREIAPGVSDALSLFGNAQADDLFMMALGKPAVVPDDDMPNPLAILHNVMWGYPVETPGESLEYNLRARLMSMPFVGSVETFHLDNPYIDDDGNPHPWQAWVWDSEIDDDDGYTGATPEDAMANALVSLCNHYGVLLNGVPGDLSALVVVDRSTSETTDTPSCECGKSSMIAYPTSLTFSLAGASVRLDGGRRLTCHCGYFEDYLPKHVTETPQGDPGASRDREKSNV